MANDRTGVKLMTIKVKGRHSLRNTDPNTVGFHGATPASTKRIRVGETFEILATPYVKQKSYFKRSEDTFKKERVEGDPREAHCVHFGWTGKQADAYLKFQFFDPETMELVDGGVEEESDNLPNDFLLKLDEKKAIKEIRKSENVADLNAWEAAEKASGTPRVKVLETLKEAIASL